MAKEDNDRTSRTGKFVGSGLVFGIALGAAFGNVGIGVAIGMILGAAFSRIKWPADV